MACGFTHQIANGQRYYGEHMVRESKTGNASTGVRRTKSIQDGLTNGNVRFGGGLDKHHLTKKHQEIRNNFPTKPHVSPPFWSDAMQCYRVEYAEHTRNWFSNGKGKQTLDWKVRTSSFFCKEYEDAVDLYVAAKDVKNWGEWLRVYDKALKIAKNNPESGFIFRTMEGIREEFRPIRT